MQLTQVAHQDIKGLTMSPLQQPCCQINWRNGYILQKIISCIYACFVCLCQLSRGGLGLCLCLGAVATAIPMSTTKGWGGGVVLLCICFGFVYIYIYIYIYRWCASVFHGVEPPFSHIVYMFCVCVCLCVYVSLL